MEDGNILMNLKAKLMYGQKESQGKLYYELDWNFITQMAERMSTNKKPEGKYQKWNWKHPLNPEELIQANIRHMIEILNGNFEDEGREFGHLEALACNAMMINYQLKELNKN